MAVILCPSDSCVLLLHAGAAEGFCNGYQNSNGALAGGADGADVSRHADVVPDQEEKVQIQVEPRWPSKHATNAFTRLQETSVNHQLS